MSPKIKHRIGDRHGALVILSRLGNVKGTERVLCRCDCGNLKEAGLPNVVSGGVSHCADRAKHPGSRWKGDGSLTYDGAHNRTKRVRGSASGYACVGCDGRAGQWTYAHADADERRMSTGREAGRPYSVHPEHYEPRCRRCHARWDAAERRLMAGHPDGGVSLVHFALYWARRGGFNMDEFATDMNS